VAEASGGSKPSANPSSLKIGKLLGIEIRVHWTFGFLILLVVAVDSSAGVGAVFTGLFWIVAIFGSVLLHELSHCVVAQRDGVVVEDILLIPIGGISQMRSIPKDPGQELGIAIVGPLTSLGLGVVFLVLGFATGAHLWPPTLLSGSWIVRIGYLNLLLGAFNLLPALPMDGGRVLRSLLSFRESRSAATKTAATIARVLAFLMIAVGLLYDFWLIFIGFFVLLAAGAEERQVDAEDPDGPGTRQGS
jgi:Zn-dependent protease